MIEKCSDGSMTKDSDERADVMILLDNLDLGRKTSAACHAGSDRKRPFSEHRP